MIHGFSQLEGTDDGTAIGSTVHAMFSRTISQTSARRHVQFFCDLSTCTLERLYRTAELSRQRSKTNTSRNNKDFPQTDQITCFKKRDRTRSQQSMQQRTGVSLEFKTGPSRPGEVTFWNESSLPSFLFCATGSSSIICCACYGRPLQS